MISISLFCASKTNTPCARARCRSFTSEQDDGKGECCLTSGDQIRHRGLWQRHWKVSQSWRGRRHRACWEDQEFGRRNVLNISCLHRTAFPSGQDLADSLLDQAVPVGDTFTAPPQHKVQLNQLGLDVRPVVPFKRRHLTGEAHRVGSNCLAQRIDTQAVQFEVI
jgi:hypothetical protein